MILTVLFIFQIYPGQNVLNILLKFIKRTIPFRLVGPGYLGASLSYEIGRLAEETIEITIDRDGRELPLSSRAMLACLVFNILANSS